MIQEGYTDPICCTSDRTLLLSHIIPTSTTASQSKNTPLYCNWKIKVPLKVQVLELIIAHGKTNTGDLVQRKRPYFCRSPHWCTMCKAKAESPKHLLNFQLLLTFPRLFRRLYDVQNPASCVSLLSESHKFFCGKKRGMF